jgi:alpha-L-rhamnosidase
MLLFVLLCALLSAVRAAAGAGLLSNLRVENVEAPLAVAVAYPRFSWTVGEQQLGYRIVVTQVSTGTIAWDSSAVKSNVSSMVVYNGATLAADADLVWTVSVDLLGLGPVSAFSTFATAPAASTLAAGQWIGGFGQLRSSFLLGPGSVSRARVHVSASGCYHLYVNGARLSHELSPGFAHAPNVRSLYDTYDIASLLVPSGDNAVGIRIGSCKFGYIGNYCEGTPAECNSAFAVISVEQGGNVTTIGSSPSTFTGTSGPVLFEHLYHGETFDARLDEVGWDKPNFQPEQPWAPAQLMPNVSAIVGPLTPSAMRPIIRANTISPVSINPLSDGSYVFDYGSNIAGVCTLNITGPSGQLVSMLHAEILNLDGSADNTYMDCIFANVSDCAFQTVNYTLAGSGAPEIYTPHFCYAGFRYVQVWGLTAAPSASTLQCHFTHSDLPAAGSVSFNSSIAHGQILNAIQAATVATHYANLMSVPTDCPQRERR